MAGFDEMFGGEDLFSFFGMESPMKEKEPKKEAKKKDTKKKDAKKESKKKEETYPLPIKVMGVMFHNGVSVTEESISSSSLSSDFAGKTALTASELKRVLTDVSGYRDMAFCAFLDLKQEGEGSVILAMPEPKLTLMENDEGVEEGALKVFGENIGAFSIPEDSTVEDLLFCKEVGFVDVGENGLMPYLNRNSQKLEMKIPAGTNVRGFSSEGLTYVLEEEMTAEEAEKKFLAALGVPEDKFSSIEFRACFDSENAILYFQPTAKTVSTGPSPKKNEFGTEQVENDKIALPVMVALGSYGVNMTLTPDMFGVAEGESVSVEKILELCRTLPNGNPFKNDLSSYYDSEKGILSFMIKGKSLGSGRPMTVIRCCDAQECVRQNEGVV